MAANQNRIEVKPGQMNSENAFTRLLLDFSGIYA
jgi:hypothetical protein